MKVDNSRHLFLVELIENGVFLFFHFHSKKVLFRKTNSQGETDIYVDVIATVAEFLLQAWPNDTGRVYTFNYPDNLKGYRNYLDYGFFVSLSHEDGIIASSNFSVFEFVGYPLVDFASVLDIFFFEERLCAIYSPDLSGSLFLICPMFNSVPSMKYSLSITLTDPQVDWAGITSEFV